MLAMRVNWDSSINVWIDGTRGLIDFAASLCNVRQPALALCRNLMRGLTVGTVAGRGETWPTW